MCFVLISVYTTCENCLCCWLALCTPCHAWDSTGCSPQGPITVLCMGSLGHSHWGRSAGAVLVSWCGHHGAQPHSCTVTPASGEPLFPLDFPHTTDMCCAVPAQRPLGTTQTERVSQDQLLPILSALVTTLLPLCLGTHPGGSESPVPSPAARGPIFPWPWLVVEVTVALWVLCRGNGV